MDPNANLQEQERILAGRTRDAPRLRELRQALTGWLRAGGFAPNWEVCPLASAYFRILRMAR